jgi:hypothetical protein
MGASGSLILLIATITTRRAAMTKLSLLGVAAVAAFTAFAAPAFAQHKASPALNAYAQTGSCAGYEAGNPYNKETDYMGWSAWRVRGGWDDRASCTRSHVTHGEF